jgi:hypothetical protein
MRVFSTSRERDALALGDTSEGKEPALKKLSLSAELSLKRNQKAVHNQSVV